MKVHLGKYKKWWGPYQLADLTKYIGMSEDKRDKIGDWLCKVPKLQAACEWIESKRGRKIKVKIDAYDVWSLDYTLALIIAPALRCLKEQKHGSGHVDDDDVPAALRANGFVDENGNNTDAHWHDRWDYVLDEMIFAFESLTQDPDYEELMHDGALGVRMVPVDKDGNEIPREGAKLFVVKNHESLPWPKFDIEMYKDYNARMQNGFRLFGQYYRGLWD